MNVTNQETSVFLEHAVQASLVDYLDKRLTVLLRDGNYYIGKLSTFDQFSNVVLVNTVHRKICGTKYADVYVGIFVVRGENVVLLGELDPQREIALKDRLQEVTDEEIRELQARNESKTDKVDERFAIDF